MFNHNNVPTLPYVLKPQTAQNNEYQQLMAIKRPNLNIQDKYVYMNGRIIERKPAPIARKSPEEEYADLLEAHKTSNYIPNPLNSSDSIYGLKQAAAASAFLQGEVMKQSPALRTDRKISILKANLLTKLVNITQDQLDIQRDPNNPANTALRKQLAKQAQTLERVMTTLASVGTSPSAMQSFVAENVPDDINEDSVEFLDSIARMASSLGSRFSPYESETNSTPPPIIPEPETNLTSPPPIIPEPETNTAPASNSTGIFGFLSRWYSGVTPATVTTLVQATGAAANETNIPPQNIPNPVQLENMNNEINEELQFFDTPVEQDQVAANADQGNVDPNANADETGPSETDQGNVDPNATQGADQNVTPEIQPQEIVPPEIQPQVIVPPSANNEAGPSEAGPSTGANQDDIKEEEEDKNEGNDEGLEYVEALKKINLDKFEIHAMLQLINFLPEFYRPNIRDPFAIASRIITYTRPKLYRISISKNARKGGDRSIESLCVHLINNDAKYAKFIGVDGLREIDVINNDESADILVYTHSLTDLLPEMPNSSYRNAWYYTLKYQQPTTNFSTADRNIIDVGELLRSNPSDVFHLIAPHFVLQIIGLGADSADYLASKIPGV